MQNPFSKRILLPVFFRYSAPKKQKKKNSKTQDNNEIHNHTDAGASRAGGALAVAAADDNYKFNTF